MTDAEKLAKFEELRREFRQQYEAFLQPTFRSFSLTDCRFFRRGVPTELRSAGSTAEDAARW